MFPLLETIKVIDGKSQYLTYHQHRFEASYYKLYHRLTTVKLQDVIQVPEEHRKGIVKLRFLYNQTDCFCQYDAYQPKTVKTLKMVIANDISYDLKRVDRKKLNKLLQQKQEADEIIIIKNQRITDTTFSNIALYDGTDWFTPKFPLLHGTARARLLVEKRIKTADIFVSDLSDFKYIKLINAMLDFDDDRLIAVSNIS